MLSCLMVKFYFHHTGLYNHKNRTFRINVGRSKHTPKIVSNIQNLIGCISFRPSTFKKPELEKICSNIAQTSAHFLERIPSLGNYRW